MKNVIFDWSGVVKDAVNGNLWITNKIFERFGADPISLEEYKQNFELPFMNFYNKYLPSLTLQENQIAYREFIFDENCPKSKKFPGIVELIKELKSKGYYLAVVSSDFPETLLKEMKDYGLDNMFDDIVTDVHDKLEGVDTIIKNKNLDLNNTFFIGDSNHEIEVSKITGIKSIAVTWGFAAESRLKALNPSYLVHDVKELGDILLD